jgi:hypothetical protein
MKRVLTPRLMACAVAMPAHATEDHAPRHGGGGVETKAGDLQLVAKLHLIVPHASDHGKPMKLNSAGGKVTVFIGNDETEATLAGDKLEARGSFKVGAGAKVLAEVALNGKSAVSARFTLRHVVARTNDVGSGRVLIARQGRSERLCGALVHRDVEG